ncbi:IS66 family insertion sequence element accessory protein TnpB [Rhodoferax ferrireducens]|uniref:IS66 family insertion sequence element accessory protein TnpB n=1 Tax=Rhodoferax ferrireducens TaxID=192843 RepID=UPI00384D58EF
MRSIDRVLPLNADLAVYLHRRAVCFCENIKGRSAIIEHDLQLNPFVHTVFVFGNHGNDHFKFPGWSRNSFVIHWHHTPLEQLLENDLSLVWRY